MTVEKSRSNETIGKEKTPTFNCVEHGTRDICFNYTEAELREGFLDYVKVNINI
jgi:hypothetical protein